MKQVFSSCIPLVKAGGLEPITVSQSLDGRLKQDGPATVHVRIDGPQTSLLADMIAGVFPAPGSDQSPDEFLAHVALTRRTLPWEREGPDAMPTTRGSRCCCSRNRSCAVPNSGSRHPR